MKSRKTRITKKPKQSIIAEAWQNMSADMARVLPQKVRTGKGLTKLALLMLVLELVVFGIAGKFLYDWLTGRPG